ncbi:Serine hydrolase [Stackebrandtia soli]
MRLRDEGVVALSDRVSRFFPDAVFGDVTVAQLLSHTAGIAAELPGSWWERSPGVDASGLWGALDASVVKHVAGRRHHYSNVGYAVLGALVERLRGGDWFSVVREEVLEPLGMSRTSLTPVAPCARGFAVHPFADVVVPEPSQETGAMGPAGQLWSTVADLARWAAFLGGATNGVLSVDSLAEMTETVTVAEGPKWVSGHGLGWQLRGSGGRRLVGHGGSMPGFQAGLWVDRSSGDGVVMVMNATTPSQPWSLSDALLSIMDECEPVMPSPWRPRESVPADELGLAGYWFWGTSAGLLRVEGDGWLRLDAVSGMMSTSRFRPVGSDEWVGLDGYYAGETLRVVRGDDGRVRHVDLGTFVLTRSPYDPDGFVPGGWSEGTWPVR